MQSIYLDHAATTPVRPEVWRAMERFASECFGNPSGVHRLAEAARNALSEARERIAERLGASTPSSILFTGGGTEADNLAVLGLARAGRGRHVIASAIEHHAVLEPCRSLQREGFEVTLVGVDGHGRVSVAEVLEALRPDTVLVSLMLVNNEVGTVQPVRALAAALRERGVLIHTDAVQAVGTLPVDVHELGVDALSLSAHKFYGPKGVGALYLRPGVDLQPVLWGGGQERGLRSGTQNVAGAVGMASALELAMEDRQERVDRLRFLSARLRDRLLEELPGAAATGHPEERHPGIVSLVFPGAEGESILMLLDRAGVMASTGSACSTASLEPSHVLRAMGIPLRLAHGSLRLSLGRSTTVEQVDRAAGAVIQAVRRLQQMAPVDL
ncbi:MAG: cysteine desulfurase family protein [Candidatus Eremiobacterota bacterium]